MTKRLRLGEFLLALQGLALSRNLFRGTNEHTDRRLAEMREILGAIATGDPDAVENLTVETVEADPLRGYAQWADTYDTAENPLIEVEQPLLEGLLSTLQPGRAIDLCCGSGRVTALLRAFGHHVTGVDQSEEMLTLARAKLPGVTFVQRPLDSTITDLGTDFDLATCALALTHFATLDAPIAALSSLLRPGGHLVLTDVHPFFTMLDGQAFFATDDGTTPWVRNRDHRFSDYLRAFEANGLDVVDCREPVPADGEGPMRSLVAAVRPDAARSAYLGLPTALAWVLRKRA